MEVILLEKVAQLGDPGDLVNVKSNHYDYFFESIYKLFKNNYKIYEVPIKLPYSKLGKSKMRLIHIIISLLTILKLRLTT